MAGLFLDQVTKVMVYGTVRTGETVRLIGSLLRVWHVHNDLGVFGLSYGPRFVYVLLPVLGSALVFWFGLRSRERWTSSAYGLILGGAMGNVIDRVRLGYVIDWVDFGWRGWHWHTFNLADACVVVGVVVLLGRELVRHRPPMVVLASPPATEKLDEPASLPR